MDSFKNCLIIAGEKSGEEHVMSFLPEIIKQDTNLSFFGVGGDEMNTLGVDLIYHLNDFSSWGITEVIGKIPFYFKAFDKVLKEVERRNCKHAILVDFQTFNLKLAEKLKKKGVKVFYYVAPQAWAWKSWRVKALKRATDILFTIIPFEKKWFLDRGVKQVVSVPHPVYLHYHEKLDHALLGLDAKPFTKFAQKKVKLLLLPGSRKFEVSELLKEFINVIKELKKEYTVEVGIVPSPSIETGRIMQYETYFTHIFKHNELDQALTWADLALAASGTITLTCALFEVPTIVCYRTSLFNAFIFYSFVNYEGPVSLANIVHQQYVFPEILQERVSTYNILNSLKKWLDDKESYEGTKTQLAKTKELLAGEDIDLPKYLREVLN